MVMKGLIKVVRRTILVLIVSIFIGYIFYIWIFSATHVYRRWYAKIGSATDSTYFGTQGSTILMYTFPFLLIAALGCLYLHLGNKMGEISFKRNRKSYKLALWKRPMIVKAFGIVFLTEIIIVIMFIALLVWSFAYNLHTSFSHAKQRAALDGDKLWQARLERSGLMLGFVGNICLVFLFFPVTRCSSILPIFGLTSEGSIKYHIWLGHVTMLLFTLHGFSYITYWIFTNRLHEMLTWNTLYVSNLAGELSLAFGLMLWVTTYPSIRQKMFELFFYTHYFYILFMVFYVFHLGFTYSYTVLTGFYLFMVDRFLRFLQSRQRVSLISARILPCQTIELNFRKTQGLRYTPTSMVFIQVAKISKLQWHPFTISSNCSFEPNKLSVIIKSEGTWTKQLFHLLNSSPSPLDYFNVSIEGPYGPVSTHFLRHEMLVLVSGGSGIAPFISIIKEIIFLTSNNKITKFPQILLISAFKHSSDLTMLELLPTLPSSLSNFGLQIEAYVTKEKEAPLQKREILRTIMFNPSPWSEPIGPALGPNTWLWLGAIISSSFVFFLIFVGILTRYYIYPVDKNTDTIFSHTSQASLNMLLLCVSIVAGTGVAFLWNKKHRGIEGTRNETTELFGEEKELESFPNQCLENFTKVHYGGRPDLKKILLERNEPSVGVLVCGPTSMRHEVASICASSSTNNLHFESISFSW